MENNDYNRNIKADDKYQIQPNPWLRITTIYTLDFVGVCQTQAYVTKTQTHKQNYITHFDKTQTITNMN